VCVQCVYWFVGVEGRGWRRVSLLEMKKKKKKKKKNKEKKNRHNRIPRAVSMGRGRARACNGMSVGGRARAGMGRRATSARACPRQHLRAAGVGMGVLVVCCRCI